MPLYVRFGFIGFLLLFVCWITAVFCQIWNIHRGYLLTLVLILFAGYFWGNIHFYLRTQQMLPTGFEKGVIVKGRVSSVPAIFNDYSQFQFDIDSIDNHPWKGKVMLSWFEKKLFLKSGQKWQLMVKLKKPRGFSNPGSFDYEAWLFEQNIVGKGYVIAEKSNHLLESPRWHYWINQIRQHIGQMWEPFAEKWPLLGVLLALTVGLTTNITAEQWQVFTNTGTIHLISISGFHISMMAGIAYSSVSFIWRRIPFLCERWPAQRAGAVGALTIGIIYSLLAGFSIPTQRSLIMLSVFMGGVLFQRQTNVWQCFLWSILAIILWDPFAPLSLSFWLSYSAVGVILYAVMDPPMPIANEISMVGSGVTALQRATTKTALTLWHWLKLQFHIFLGLIPFSFFWFSQVSASSLWANLVAIPVTGFFVLPFALAAIICQSIYFPLAVFLMKVAHWFFYQLYLYLNWVSHDYPVILVWPLDQVWMLLLGVLGILLLLAPKGWPGRWLGLVFWFPLLFPLDNSPSYGEARFSLLDVGQGLSSVVQTQHHVLVFDTGPKFSENFDTGKAVVLPYLRNQHLRKVDAVVISHGDMDHSGGLKSLLKNIAVKRVYVNDVKVLKTGLLCQPTMKWRWDGVTFQFLTRGLANFTDTNDTSCVLKVSNGHHSLLLPGDLEAKGERALTQVYGELLKTDLLIAGHHGSKTSSSQKWLDYTRPHYTLFATGYLNRYRFPNKDIVVRYQQRGIKTWSTSDCGMIRWILPITKKMQEPMCYRLKYPHPWLS